MLNFVIPLYIEAFKISCSAELSMEILLPRDQEFMLFPFVKRMENTEVSKSLHHFSLEKRQMDIYISN